MIKDGSPLCQLNLHPVDQRMPFALSASISTFPSLIVIISCSILWRFLADQATFLSLEVQIANQPKQHSQKVKTI
jgi:hypothetical protein